MGSSQCSSITHLFYLAKANYSGLDVDCWRERTLLSATLLCSYANKPMSNTVANISQRTCTYTSNTADHWRLSSTAFGQHLCDAGQQSGKQARALNEARNLYVFFESVGTAATNT